MSVPSSLTALADGGFAASQVLEFLALPHWELLAETVQEAATTTDSLFARLVNDIHRRDSSGGLSIELLFVTTEAAHQTYKAQVRSFLILRGIGKDAGVLSDRLEQAAANAEFVLKEHQYSVERTSQLLMPDFQRLMAEVDAEAVVAVARQERVLQSQAGLGFYYNDVIIPSEGENGSIITNALSQCPNAAVSLQLIPTAYTDEEQAGIEMRRMQIDAFKMQMMMTPGAAIPSGMSDASMSYADFVKSKQENVFYFNFLVYGPRSYADTFSGKVIDALEADTRIGSNALAVVDAGGAGISLTEDFDLSPWKNSDKLVYDLREPGFWNNPTAPRDLIRLRYLAPTRIVRAAFKVPFDDDRVVGLETKRSMTSRSKLNDRVLSKDSFRIGVIADSARNGDAGVQVGVPLDDFAKHTLVVGASGYGKTNFALGMLYRFWHDHHVPFLAIEPTKTEYRSLLEAIPELSIFTPGRNEVSPFIINPFVPPPGVTVESYVPSLMTAFNAAFNMLDPLPSIFRAAINDCYNLYGWKSTSTVSDPHVKKFGFYEFIRVFKDRMKQLDYKGETRSNIESAGVVRLSSLLEHNANIYDTVNTIPVEDLLAQPTVIELNAISDKEQKSLLMALLLVRLCIYTKNNVALDGRLKNVLLIDEAHVLLGGSPSATVEGRDTTVEALEDMIAEVRAYGTGIVIADQSPVNVGRDIIANTDVKVAFRLVERENRQMIASAANMDENDENLLGRLGVGECLLQYGRLDAPLHVRVADVETEVVLDRSVDNQRVHERVRFWGTRRELLVPFTECALSAGCVGGCDFSTRVDADFVAARVATYYSKYISEWEHLQSFILTKVRRAVTSTVESAPGIESSPRLLDCATLRVVRKLLLAKSIAVSDAQIRRLLLDHRVMGSGVESTDESPERTTHG